MKHLFWIILTFGCVGCQNIDKPEPPDNLIPKDKMVAIITDAYLSNAARGFNTRIVREKGYKLDSILYASYAIDSAQFAQSNAYYATDLDTYEAMFTKVSENLELLKMEKDSLKAIYEERIRVRDSLKVDSIAKDLREMNK